jgi:hypothetical protein
MTPALAAVVALLAAGPAPPTMTSPEEFVAAVRGATSRYHDRERAVADGYRLIGGDFPAMGEHWINIGLVFGVEHDPMRPEFLTYVTVDGKPRLTGVAYAVPLMPDELPPAWPWAGARWHDHVRTVDEETLLPHAGHAGHAAHAGHAGHEAGDGEESAQQPRLAMAHAWVWLANPDGDFAADNWAIPYFRLGLDTPADAPVACAKALSLASGGAEHLAGVLEAAGARAPSERKGVRKALERTQRSVAEILRGRGGPRLDASRLSALADQWARLWMDVDRALPEATRSRVAAFR